LALLADMADPPTGVGYGGREYPLRNEEYATYRATNATGSPSLR
jgi:hypothetical protein